MKNAMKVLGDRVLLQSTNIYEKEEYLDEKTKRMATRDVFKDFSREMKVLAKGSGEYADKITLGSTVYAMPFGGVEIDKLSSKKYRVICIPAMDVYLEV